MTPLPTQTPHPPTVEEGVNALIADVKHSAQSRYEEYEACIRKSPGKAVLIAVAAGYCLHRLPLRSLLVSQVRLMAALAPPTLLAFGAAKLCEFLQYKARETTYSPPMLRHAGELHEVE